MRKIVARTAAAVILSTGIFAGSLGPANAAPEKSAEPDKSISSLRLDTGWG